MSNSSQASAQCKHCGIALTMDHQGPCHACGGSEKEIIVSIGGASETDEAYPVGRGMTVSLGTASEIDEAHPVSWKKVREYMEKRPLLMGFLVIIAIISPFLGLLLAGLAGVILGLLLSIVSLVIGPYAATKVREIERGGS